MKNCTKQKAAAFIKNIKLIRSFRFFLQTVDARTYYPEKERKSYIRRLYDNLWWSLKYREPNMSYTAYGLDIINSDAASFLDEKHSVRTRSLMNGTRKGKKIKTQNQTVLVEDKFVFYCFLKGLKVSTPECFALVNHGKLMFLNGYSELKMLQNNNKIFAKKCMSGQGKDVRCITSKKELDDILKEWNNDKFILQEAVTQHSALNQFYDQSVNTIRLVTFHDGEKVMPFHAFLRCGTRYSGKVDNVHSGGLAIGIDAEGKLMKYGYLGIHYGTKTTIHPDTGVTFYEKEIPFYEEAVREAVRLHEKMEGICSVGWDIAITENGPIFLEGNAGWGLEMVQICYGGIRKDWLELCRKRGL